MKKVGLITYHASHNIGSMLQTYAMQYILTNKYKMDVEVIDFSSKAQQNMYSMFPTPNSIKGLGRVGINLLTYPILKSRFNDYELFITKHFNLTCGSFEYDYQLKELSEKYDYIIAGSDQIWNVNCEDFSDAYFLPFKTKAKKIAYAPSLGGRNILKSDVNLDKYKGFINDFDYLSVREENGKKWLEELSENTFDVVADPTILVNRDVWEDLSHEVEYEGDYIFFYGVPFSPKTYDIVCEISKKLNLPVIMLDAKSYIYRGNFARGIKLWKHCSPSDYLGLIKNSKLVITTSFHGSIFASIFRKNFWAITFKETNKDDDRISVLFEQLNLTERLIYIEDHDNYELLSDVDYSSYDADITKFRERSFEFLDDALGFLEE
ncbi:polysaccharide pyruvyl transferase family protein [Vibrio splendidus]